MIPIIQNFQKHSRICCPAIRIRFEFHFDAAILVAPNAPRLYWTAVLYRAGIQISGPKECLRRRPSVQGESLLISSA
jgi:hypothetical protein